MKGYLNTGVKQSISVVVVTNDSTSRLTDHLDQILLKLSANETYLWEVVCVISRNLAEGLSNSTLEGFSRRGVRWVAELTPGIYVAMNTGMFAADSEFVIFMNCGDKLLALPTDLVPDKINCFPVVYEGASGILRRPGSTGFVMPHHQGTFFPRIIYKKNPYDERYKLAADLDYFLRFQKHYILREDPTVARFELGGASMQKKNRIARIRERYLAAARNGKVLKIVANDVKKFIGK